MQWLEIDRQNVLQFSRKVLETALYNPALRLQWDWIEPLKLSYPVENNQPTGVFVTLKVNDQLRGCVGIITGEKPLLDTIAQITLQSAFQDPRFPPLKPEEFLSVKLEISVLSPLEKIQTPDEIVPKLHGVYLKKDDNSGIFLPQVWEELPDRNQFLSELCMMKAGLSPDAFYDPETEIYVFTTEHFVES
jgi:AmmeMemoRadiSam system protein A